MEAEHIDELRREIDRIDKKLVELLSERANKALEVGRFKRNNGMATLDPGREKQLIGALLANNEGPLPDLSLKNIFSEIISACRSIQSPTRIAYLGPKATFTHQAALDYFGRSSDYSSQNSIPEVFRSVLTGETDYGVVPVENSNEGAVGVTLDELARSELRICGETYLRISHSFMSKAPELGDVTRVLSHPQALAQCMNWLSRHVPNAEIIPVASTAAAAQEAAADPQAAAVGGQMLAEMRGLEILASNIQDFALNLTRFLLIGAKASPSTGKDKTSIVFATAHQPGALNRALTAFSEREINLTRIESRPSKETPWEYLFFVDLEGHASDGKVRDALEDLKGLTLKLKILGSYAMGELHGQARAPSGNPVTGVETT